MKVDGGKIFPEDVCVQLIAFTKDIQIVRTVKKAAAEVAGRYGNCLCSVLSYEALDENILQRFRQEKLLRAVKEALMATTKLDGIGVESDGRARWILKKDILEIEALGDEAIIYLNTFHIIVRITLKNLLTRLNEDFFQFSVRRRGELLRVYRNYVTGREAEDVGL